MGDEKFRRKMRDAVKDFPRPGVESEPAWGSFAQGLYYLAGDYEESKGYLRLKEFLAKIDRERSNRGNRIFYLATPPDLYAPVIQQIAAAGLAVKGGRDAGWARGVFLKTFMSE